MSKMEKKQVEQTLVKQFELIKKEKANGKTAKIIISRR